MVYQRDAVAKASPGYAAVQGSTPRAVEPEDLSALIALDEQAFGVGRTTLCAKLLPMSQGVVLTRNGRIAAFALCRR